MCPECHEPMIAYELEGIEIDRCLRCHGVWLDAGELEMFTELVGVEPGSLSAALGTPHRIGRIRALRRKRPQGRPMSCAAIAKTLNDGGVPTRYGAPWRPSTIASILGKR